MNNDLDPVLSTPVRLGIVSILIKLKEADFTYLMERTESTQGNMSHQLKKLEEAEYVSIDKRMSGRYPKTYISLTKKGKNAFEKYLEDLKVYLHLI
jgi:DNA-binding transcriptional ArsR family regulator